MTDILIIGAGLSGATIANLIASDYPDLRITIIEKRPHIAGNVYDYIDEETNIRVSKYGAHLWHTNDEEIWKYIQKFGPWRRWDHQVVAKINDCTYVPIPVNPSTVNILKNENIQNQKEMDEWIKNNTIQYKNSPKNSEEVALSRVGYDLYNLLFKQYTIKQWNKSPAELDPSVLARIPIQNTFDNRYFQDKYQALPVNGYTSIVENMLNLSNIKVILNTDWSHINHTYGKEAKIIVFTGPIDTYFNNLPKLEYRSIDFIREVVECPGYFQPNSVVNYPNNDTPYTRTVEYKHFLYQKSDKTVLFHEKTTDIGEPYYPVPNEKNIKLYNEYKIMAENEKNTHFIGRLANYKYFNMDQAVRNSYDYYYNVLKKEINSNLLK